jgi:malate dehydrogenase (oxaloacetate-decarboxylating)
MSRQCVVILGAGSSAIGISDQIVAAMMGEGLTEQEAKSAIWLLDSRGLVHSGRSDLEPAKQKFAQPFDLIHYWQIADHNRINLTDVVKNVHPTVLIGTSAQPGAFTEELIREMAKYVESPIILPLSNPTSKSEATPSDLLKWTEGRALIATGSPFPPVDYNGHLRQIGQCNNAFIFPGVGLGVIASGARWVTQGMFIAAARTLANLSPVLQDSYASLYPALEGVRGISRAVALAVSLEAQQAGLTEPTSSEDLQKRIDTTMWTPRYKRYHTRQSAQ